MTSLPTRLRRRLRRRSTRSNAGERQPGQALVEFALGLPVMLLIMAGTLDIGQVFIDYVELRNACREGVSYAARNPTDYVAIENRVFDHSPKMNDGNTDVDVEYPDGVVFDPEEADGMTIAVRGTRVVTPIMTAFLQSYFGIGDFTLEAVATAEVLK